MKKIKNFFLYNDDLIVPKAQRNNFVFSYFCLGKIFCVALLFFSSFSVLIAKDTGSAEKTETTVEIEEQESEKEKELNKIKYGLDDEISSMLDEFIKDETYLYLDEIYDLFLRSKTTGLREKIITYFTKAKDPRLTDYALEILEDPFDTKKSTVSLLFTYVSELKITEAAVFAKNLLENDNMEYFDSALSALAEIGSVEDAEFLAEYIDRDDLSVGQRQSVMKALGRLKAVETWDSLVEIIQNEDENSFVRMYAAEAIGAMEKAESVPVLIDLFESNDPNFRTSVVKALSNYSNDEEAIGVIIESIRDSHYKVRLESISAIKKMELKEAEDYVVYRAKNDPESSVKYACYDTIVALDSKEGLDYLVSILKDKKQGDTAKSKAAEALLKHGGSSYVNAVIDLAKETLSDTKKKQLRYALGKLFAKQENSAYADICLEYLKSDDVSTVGTGLDIYAKNHFPSVTPEVQKIANTESKTQNANKTKARKILDRE
ncbi:MAG: HEAT repeat domain-containing protein [Spirochaetaceae bacterium]|nr:HEAT repeat domain-containing protein [Spirochaetaceae bacterium]